MNKRDPCAGCAYAFSSSGGKHYCQYAVIVGHGRGGPSGAECMVRKEKDKRARPGMYAIRRPRF